MFQVLADLPDLVPAPEDETTQISHLLVEVCKGLGKNLLFPRPIFSRHQGSLLEILSTTVLVVEKGARVVKALAQGRGQVVDSPPQWINLFH